MHLFDNIYVFSFFFVLKKKESNEGQMLPLLPTKGGEAREGLETHPANLPSSVIVSKEQKHSGKRLCCDVTTSGCREVQGADL